MLFNCMKVIQSDLDLLIVNGKRDVGCTDNQIKVDMELLWKIKGYIEGAIDFYGFHSNEEYDEEEYDAEERIKALIERLEREEKEENETTEVTVEEISETNIDEIIEKLEMAKRGEVEITKLTFEGRLIHE